MPANKTILVVEDNEINRLMLSELLSLEYTVLEAENGQQALDVLEKRKDEISLILLDITHACDGWIYVPVDCEGRSGPGLYPCDCHDAERQRGG